MFTVNFKTVTGVNVKIEVVDSFYYSTSEHGLPDGFRLFNDLDDMVILQDGDLPKEIEVDNDFVFIPISSIKYFDVKPYKVTKNDKEKWGL